MTKLVLVSFGCYGRAWSVFARLPVDDDGRVRFSIRRFLVDHGWTDAQLNRVSTMWVG